jgi:hypothetical protein
MGRCDGLAVKGGRQAEAAFHPALQYRALAAVGIEHPAAQEAQIAVFQTFAAAGSGLFTPLVQLKGDVHVVGKQRRPLLRIVHLCQAPEQVAMSVAHPLQFDGLRVAVEVPRGEHPGGQVAKS